MYGGIEAGGTKFNCIVASGPGQVLDRSTVPTTSPAETLAHVVRFFKPHRLSGRIEAIGIGSFGPCDLDLGSPTYGYITSTPKPGWQRTDIVGAISSALSVKVAFDTDVNAAAFGEATWGAAVGLGTSLYLTIGTGIGGGLIVGGRPLHGLQHPEMGHIRIPHDLQSDPFRGACPFHGDCFEGLASGPAIQARFNRRGETLPDDHPFWEIEAGYIAFALVNYVLTVSPQRVVLGGGIMQREFLFGSIRKHVQRLLAAYLDQPPLNRSIDSYIVSPRLGSDAGALGAVALAAALAVDRSVG